MAKQVRQRARAMRQQVRQRIEDVMDDILDAIAPEDQVDVGDVESLESTVSALIALGVHSRILPESEELLSVAEHGRIADRLELRDERELREGRQ